MARQPAVKGLSTCSVQDAAKHDWYDRCVKVGSNYHGAARYAVVTKTGERFDDLKALKEWAGL